MKIANRTVAGLALVVGLALAATAPAHAMDFGWEAGSGVAKTESRDVGSFTKIDASGATTLEVTAGQSSTTVTVSGDDNVVPLVKTIVSGDTLRIETHDVHHTKLPLVVKVGMPKLAAIDASGASKINVSNLSGGRFALDGSGSTKATVAGSVDKFVVRLSGAGNVDANALATKEADIDGSGASHVEVNASETLTVRISGAGKVLYSGHPTINQSISGAAKIAAK
jgi:hypothetical protein